MGAIGYEASSSERTFTMPHRITGDDLGRIDWRVVLGELGFTSDPEGRSDQYGRLVTLPEGWRVVHINGGGEYIVDAKGRYRVSITGTYKFYDPLSGKSAHLLSWLSIASDDLFASRNIGERIVVIGGGERTLFTSPVFGMTRDEAGYFSESGQAAMRTVTEWRDKHYPDWRNPLKYWD